MLKWKAVLFYNSSVRCFVFVTLHSFIRMVELLNLEFFAYILMPAFSRFFAYVGRVSKWFPTFDRSFEQNFFKETSNLNSKAIHYLKNEQMQVLKLTLTLENIWLHISYCSSLQDKTRPVHDWKRGKASSWLEIFNLARSGWIQLGCSHTECVTAGGLSKLLCGRNFLKFSKTF